MDRLRILILSTPKTGNTWLVNLLSALYDLPKLGLLCPFDYEQASRMGPRWVVFSHLMPEPELLRWIEETRPFVITTVRHPGDVLISLYHHLRRFSADPVDLAALRDMLTQPFERVEIYPPAVHTFEGELACSIAWIRSGLTRVVRYEDLRYRTLETMQELVHWIKPASQARIEQAIARSDLGLMRSLAGKHGAFFRSGTVGGWRSELAPDILAILAAEPYRRQFLELGYTLDPATGETAAHHSIASPFPSHFDNGVPVAPILIDFYLSLDPERNRRWPPLASNGPGSFLEWIDGPSGLPGAGAYSGVPLTRLAHYIHRSRPDLEQTYRDLTGPDRARYAEWFLREHAAEYGLAPHFAASTRRSFFTWANEASELAGTGLYAGVPLSKFAHYLHDTRADLRESFPDLTGSSRAAYAEWFIGESGRWQATGAPDQDLTAAARQSFFQWGRGAAEVPGAGSYATLPLTKLAHYYHEARTDLQQRFPNLAGSARAGYAEWFIREQPSLPQDFAAAARQSFLAWGKARHPLDRERRPWWPRLTNYAVYVYETNTDVRAAFPDVFVRDRWSFLEWLVSPVSGLTLFPEFTGPIRKSLERRRFVRRVGAALNPF